MEIFVLDLGRGMDWVRKSANPMPDRCRRGYTWTDQLDIFDSPLPFWRSFSL